MRSTEFRPVPMWRDFRVWKTRYYTKEFSKKKINKENYKMLLFSMSLKLFPSKTDLFNSQRATAM